MASVHRADHDAGWLTILGRQVLVVNPVDAQGAFLHHAFVGIELARAIRARPGAELAAYADCFIDQYNAVLSALVGGAGRAHRYAGGFLAVQTGFREVNGSRALALALLKRMNAVEPHPPSVIAIGAEVRQRSHMAAGVPFLARRRAGMAANADVEIDNEPELLLAGPRFRQRCHGDPSPRWGPAK